MDELPVPSPGGPAESQPTPVGWVQICVEYSFALGVAALLVADIYFLLNNGYLPQPFFYDVSDTFMDWFNPAYYAHNGGAFDAFGSIYPPLTFVIMRVLGLPHCYKLMWGMDTRQCDWLGVATLLVSYVIDIVLVAKIFIRVDRRTALPRGLALCGGMPILFGLERGNIIIMCFAFVMLAFGPLLRSARWRWFFAALAINLKIYLVGMVMALLLRRRWVWTEGAMLMTLVVYLVTYMILGDGTLGEIIENIKGYTTELVSAQQVLGLWYSDTYQPLLALLHAPEFPITATVGSRLVDVASLVVPMLVLFGQLSVVLAAIATWLRPEVVPNHRVVFLGLMLAVISTESSGYTMMIPLFFVFMEKWTGIGRIVALITGYILCLPTEIVLASVPPIINYSYFADRMVEVHYGIGLGAFLRPALGIVLAVSLSWVTIHDVWTDIRKQGWKDRWRFRRDWPLLPGVMAPVPPSLSPDQP